MRVRVLAFAAVLAFGCSDIASEAGDECQRLLDETVPALLDEVEARCRDQIQEAVDGLSDEFSTLLDDVIHDAEVEVLTRFGCVPDDSTAGWDCTGSLVCE